MEVLKIDVDGSTAALCIASLVLATGSIVVHRSTKVCLYSLLVIYFVLLLGRAVQLFKRGCVGEEALHLGRTLCYLLGVYGLGGRRRYFAALLAVALIFCAWALLPALLREGRGLGRVEEEVSSIFGSSTVSVAPMVMFLCTVCARDWRKNKVESK